MLCCETVITKKETNAFPGYSMFFHYGHSKSGRKTRVNRQYRWGGGGNITFNTSSYSTAGERDLDSRGAGGGAGGRGAITYAVIKEKNSFIHNLGDNCPVCHKGCLFHVVVCRTFCPERVYFGDRVMLSQRSRPAEGLNGSPWSKVLLKVCNKALYLEQRPGFCKLPVGVYT